MEETTSAQSLSTFRQRLKIFLFMKSYPDVIFWIQTLHTVSFS